ncbi:MAG: LiaI-LiaF-like domain-containing protein [Candidatus Bipolaricaulia bacterium]
MSVVRTIFGSLIAAVGIILLLNQFGYLPWYLWGDLVRLWPALLIAIGISLLLHPFTQIGPILAPIIILAIAIGAVVVYDLRYEPLPGEIKLMELSQPVAGIDRAEITVDFHDGSLEIAGGGEGMVEGTVHYHPDLFDLDPRYRIENGIGRLEVIQTGRARGRLSRRGYRNDWNLRFHDGLPLSLALRCDVARARLDLTTLDVERLEIDANVSDIEINFGIHSGIVDIDLDVSRLTMKIPRELGVRVRVDTDLSLKRFEGLTQAEPGLYLSENFESMTERLEIHLNGDLSQIDVVIVDAVRV